MTSFKELSLLRVIGTLLVVFSHSYYVYTYGQFASCDIASISLVRRFIIDVVTRFNMPTFCFISGYLFAFKLGRTSDMGFGCFLIKKSKRLLIPYILFLPITLISLGTIELFICQPWIELLKPVGHLWFIMMLFLMFSIIYPIRGLFRSKIGVISILSLACFAYILLIVNDVSLFFLGGGNMLAISDLYKHMPFFLTGSVMYVLNIGGHKGFVKFLFGTSLLLVITLYGFINYYYVNGHFSLYRILIFLQSFFYVLLFYTMSVILVNIPIVAELVSTKCYNQFSSCTFGIYLFHAVIINSILTFLPYKTIAFHNPILFGFMLFMLSLLFSYWLTRNLLQQRYGRIALGT